MSPVKRLPRGRQIPRLWLLSDFKIRGRKIHAEVAQVVTDAQVSVSTTQVSEIALTIYDPRFQLLRSGLFDKGGSADFRKFNQEITVVETQPAADGKGSVTIRCRSESVGKLKRRRGPLVMRQASPSDFVRSECKAAKVPYVVQDSPNRRQVARDTKKNTQGGGGERPSTWTTFQRLAKELGYIVFESGGVIYFGQPTWLWKRDGKPAVVTWNRNLTTDCIGTPAFRDSEDSSEEGVSVTFEVPRERLDEFMPGERVNFRFPWFGDKKYLVTSLAFPLAGDGNCTVTASNPVNPRPQPPESRSRRNRGGGGGYGGQFYSTKGSKKLGDLLAAAGFKGRALDIAAGIAIAESGGKDGGKWFVNANAIGDTALQDNKWGPSIGVFQIRSLRSPGNYSGEDRLRQRAKLHDAFYNARTAYKLSNGGRDWSAWSTWHSGSYKAHVGKTGAIVRGWSGLSGSQAGRRRRRTGSTEVRGRRSATDFVTLCLRQVGDTYVYGAEVDLDSRNPRKFDCSELIQWAAHQVGVYIPDGSSNQMQYMRNKGTTISVAAAMRTRGALLWKPGHIAISLGGNSGTVEALNPGAGVVRMGPSRSFRWEGAGLIPGMRYGGGRAGAKAWDNKLK